MRDADRVVARAERIAKASGGTLTLTDGRKVFTGSPNSDQ